MTLKKKHKYIYLKRKFILHFMMCVITFAFNMHKCYF